jgi:integrase
MSACVIARPPETGPDLTVNLPTGENTMKPELPKDISKLAAPVTLQDVIDAIGTLGGHSATRRRDLRSAVTRVSHLLGQDPGSVPLDLPALRKKLAALNPVSKGLTTKTFSNIRSDFMAAVKASGLTHVYCFRKIKVTEEWAKVMAQLPNNKWARMGVSLLARYASSSCITPEQIDDSVMERFMATIRNSSLHRSPERLHRTASKIWNGLVSQREFNIRAVSVPSYRRPCNRISWQLLPQELRDEVQRFLTWCAGTDAFAPNARQRPLARRTIELCRCQLQSAITALVETGVEHDTLTSLADLVSVENFRRILRRRHEMVGGRSNFFNAELAKTLVRIARDWLKADSAVLAELNRLTRKIPVPLSGLTEKNKHCLRQFDDPAALERLFNLPHRLWAEVRHEQKPNQRTLCKAQAALAIAVLSYMPIRLRNLAALTFDVHLFVREGAGAISTLELPAAEVKNHREVAFDIPCAIAKMMVEYRHRIAPKIIGYRPDRLFVNIDGTPKKSPDSIGRMISESLRKRAGLEITPHQFRHLSASILLDAEPGGFETVRQLLGHTSLNTTVGAYTGINTRRAARHHHRIIEKTLTRSKLPERKTEKKTPEQKKKKRKE